MGAGDYVVGLVCFAGMLLACGGAAWVVVDRRLGGLPVGGRSVAFGLLPPLAIVAVPLIPGALGLLAEPAVLVASGLVLGGTWWLIPRGAGARPGYPDAVGPRRRASVAIAGVGVVVIAVYLLALV